MTETRRMILAGAAGLTGLLAAGSSRALIAQSDNPSPSGLKLSCAAP